jgi:hypothetical protein
MREALLIIMACLPQAGTCAEYTTPALEPVTEDPCTASRLSVVREWQERNPGLVIQYWRCEPKR